MHFYSNEKRFSLLLRALGYLTFAFTVEYLLGLDIFNYNPKVLKKEKVFLQISIRNPMYDALFQFIP